MNEHALKVGFEGIKFGHGKYRKFSAAPTEALTMACMYFNKRHVCQLAPVSRENKWGTSQHTCITIVKLVHRRPLAHLV